MTTIVGISLDNRLESSLNFQKILTKYGCIIKTRIGLHSNNPSGCSDNGIVLLEVVNDGSQLINELSEYWKIQTMFFE